jgi:hypothetical protein
MRLPSAAAIRPNVSMYRPITFAASLVLSLVPLAAAAQTLPATAPTSLPATGTPEANMTAPINGTAPAVVATRPHHAEVVFANEQLTVRANDSSLHQILSSIAHTTGMKITGGVEEQRVFGSYGPGNASTILATLLDGTGVNMLIREDDNHRPTELALSPRAGGAAPPVTAQEADLGMDLPVAPANLRTTPLPEAVRTSPSVQAGQPTSQPSQQPNAGGPPSMPQPLNNPLGNPNNVTPTASQIPTTNSVPTDSLPTPSTAQQPAQGIVDTPNQTPSNTSPLTADQVYQQLLKMQAAKAAQSNSTTTTPPPQ